jgi:hypothetical protein
MNHNEEIFRQFTSYFGPPMTPEDFDKEHEAAGLPGDFWHVPVLMMSQIAEQFKGKTNSHGMKFNYFCGLNNHPSANAVTGVQDETFCIAVYYGLLVSIQEIAYWLFNDPEFLTDIGNTALIRHPFPDKLSVQKLGVGHIWKDRVASGKAPFPDNYFHIGCPTRFEAAQLLVVEMMFFVVLHELAHIKMGHVLYNGEFFGAAHIMEVDVKPAKGDIADASIVSRVFEYDADLNALRDLLYANSPFFGTILVDKDSASRIRILAPFLVLTLFLLEWKLSLEGVQTHEHPDPLKRMYALKRWLDTHAEFRELRDRGCIKMLESDVAKASRSTAIIDVPIAVLLAKKGSMADPLWGEQFEKEYALAAEHSYRAFNWGFGIRG